MVRHLISSFLIAVFLLFPRPAVSAVPLSLKASGYFISGDDVDLTAIIDRKDGDRKITITLDCIDYFSSSTQDITEKSPSRITVSFRGVLPGDCQGIARLVREEKGKLKEYVAVSQVIQVSGSLPSWVGA